MDIEQHKRKVILERVKFLENIINYDELSWNINITIDVVLKYKDKPLNWYVLSSKISIKDIIKYHNLPWRWSEISKSYKLKKEDVMNNINLPWNWKEISSNIYLKLTINDLLILNSHNLPLDWYYLSGYSIITIQDILDNPNIPWNAIGLSKNSNILWSKEDENNYIKQDNAAKVIQKQWLKSYCDPKYNLCRKRLLNEFELLNS